SPPSTSWRPGTERSGSCWSEDRLQHARLGRLPVVATAGPQAAEEDHRLIEDVTRHGNEGIGKPEPLKHGFQGYWSRRINDEHRPLYKVLDDEVRIAACRYHYE